MFSLSLSKWCFIYPETWITHISMVQSLTSSPVSNCSTFVHLHYYSVVQITLITSLDSMIPYTRLAITTLVSSSSFSTLYAVNFQAICLALTLPFQILVNSYDGKSNHFKVFKISASLKPTSSFLPVLHTQFTFTTSESAFTFSSHKFLSLGTVDFERTGIMGMTCAL